MIKKYIKKLILRYINEVFEEQIHELEPKIEKIRELTINSNEKIHPFYRAILNSDITYFSINVRYVDTNGGTFKIRSKGDNLKDFIYKLHNINIQREYIKEYFIIIKYKDKMENTGSVTKVFIDFSGDKVYNSSEIVKINNTLLKWMEDNIPEKLL